jgi:hypothetical protein
MRIGRSGVGVVVRSCSCTTLLVVDEREAVSGWAGFFIPTALQTNVACDSGICREGDPVGA